MTALSETYSFSEVPFVTGNFQLVSEPETIASGAGALPAGAILGRVTASGTWVPSLQAASDGSEVPRGVLAVPVDASAVAVQAPVFKTGIFNPDALSFGEGHNEATVKAAWEGLPLFLRRPLSDG